MKYVLISGAQSVGKSETVFRLANHLVKNKGYIDINNAIPQQQEDFFAILEKNGMFIAIKSGADYSAIHFKQFCNKSNKPINLIISAIRDEIDPLYKDFYDCFNISNNDYVLEIPLGKVRRGVQRKPALDWYRKTIDNLLQMSIEKTPFSI
ncbi:MAG: hypothetical protein LBL61_07020 [Elusimicrobiota bacterium]|nr:hypothetical protein [Elusimicrobiota bacterium]